jgi:hypothetical protein
MKKSVIVTLLCLICLFCEGMAPQAVFLARVGMLGIPQPLLEPEERQ